MTRVEPPACKETVHRIPTVMRFSNLFMFDYPRQLTLLPTLWSDWQISRTFLAGNYVQTKWEIDGLRSTGKEVKLSISTKV